MSGGKKVEVNSCMIVSKCTKSRFSHDVAQIIKPKRGSQWGISDIVHQKNFGRKITNQ